MIFNRTSSSKSVTEADTKKSTEQKPSSELTKSSSVDMKRTFKEKTKEEGVDIYINDATYDDHYNIYEYITKRPYRPERSYRKEYSDHRERTSRFSSPTPNDDHQYKRRKTFFS